MRGVTRMAGGNPGQGKQEELMEENLRPLRLRPWSPKQTTGATHSLYLPDALWAKLCTQAEREGRSVSALVSAIVGRAIVGAPGIRDRI